MEYDQGDIMAMSPVLPEHEHGLGISGLRRIRQQPSRPQTRSSSPEASFTLPPRSSSMTLGLSSQRRFTPGSGGPSSPVLNFTEDLSRFPSESLHSFSFAHQSEDVLHNRQNVLRRSIDFMRDRLGWAANHPGLVTAQAKVTGDAEIQSMMELLVRANVLGNDIEHSQRSRFLSGPLTGPADVDASNVFERAFLPRSQSPDELKKTPLVADKEQAESSDPAGLQSTHTESSLSSETNNGNSDTSNRTEPRSPLHGPLEPKPPPMSTGRSELKRTYTDLSLLTLQTKLVETLARPYVMREDTADSNLLSPTSLPPFGKPPNSGASAHSGVHGHPNRWAPAAQAIFTTEAHAPWTILAANDLACLVFGVTKAEVRKLGILEVVREDRRLWLEERLRSPGSEATAKARQLTSKSIRTGPAPSTPLTMGGGVTAQLLSKPPSRQLAKQRASTGDATESKKKAIKSGINHAANKSRGVLLCGDVVPIQKRNGVTGSASLWVKEKRGGLIWVLEEITEDTASIRLDDAECVQTATGSVETIWGEPIFPEGTTVPKLIPRIPISKKGGTEAVDLAELKELEYYTAKNADGAHIPISVSFEDDPPTLRVSSFPHIAGIMVLSAADLKISSSNSVFSAALFGRADPDGMSINELIPQFDKILGLLTEEDNMTLHDGIVIPEHSFRRARPLLALRDGNADAAAIFLRPTGLVAKHRDGSEINVDVQMRVVRSERNIPDEVIEETSEDQSDVTSDEQSSLALSEVVYALWITYSRHLHSSVRAGSAASLITSRPGTPPRQPSPGQSNRPISPPQIDAEEYKPNLSPASLLSQQILEAASQPISGNVPKKSTSEPKSTPSNSTPRHSSKKKKISEFVVLEEMGQGAYGQVKLATYARNSTKVVLKYVTKRRILVDTWTRDRRLGTVPLEIHVLDYLRKDGLRHSNIVEMTDFFEDDINYYIEMVPHGLPGMDLFDYIEMRSTMDEAECRNIFSQVVAALHHLHTKALVVHRDIKDENIVLDGENKVKLIDFGSAAYIKNGPFEVFVGTIGSFPHSASPSFPPYPLLYLPPFSSPNNFIPHRLRRPRSPPRPPLPRQRTRRLGPRYPPLYPRLQGKPLLQHRRDHGP